MILPLYILSVILAWLMMRVHIKRTDYIPDFGDVLIILLPFVNVVAFIILAAGTAISILNVNFNIKRFFLINTKHK